METHFFEENMDLSGAQKLEKRPHLRRGDTSMPGLHVSCTGNGTPHSAGGTLGSYIATTTLVEASPGKSVIDARLLNKSVGQSVCWAISTLTAHHPLSSSIGQYISVFYSLQLLDIELIINGFISKILATQAVQIIRSHKYPAILATQQSL